MNKKIKIIIGIASFFMVSIIAISVFFIVDNLRKTASITFAIAPLSADIKLNGVSYNNSQTYNVVPDNYVLEGYFEPYQEVFTLKDHESKTVYLEMTAIEGTNWYEDHPEDGIIMDTIIEHELNEASEFITEKYPLLGILPINVEYYTNDSEYVYYTISYNLEDTNNPIILVKDYTGNNYDNAINRIKLEGYDPADYKIEYQDKTEQFNYGY